MHWSVWMGATEARQAGPRLGWPRWLTVVVMEAIRSNRRVQTGLNIRVGGSQ